MTNKKIAIVINSLKVGGGAEKTASALADGLKGRGHDVFVFVFSRSEEECAVNCEITVLESALPKNSLGALSAIFSRGKEIAKKSKERSIDTFISFMEEANFASLSSKIIFGNKARVICSVRNNPEKKKPMARFLMRALYRFADGLVVNSSALAGLLEGFSSKVSVVYNPMDYEEAQKRAVEDLSMEDAKIFGDGPVFVNIGRLHPQKGQDVLIRAFSLVVKETPQAKLVFIGEGESKERLMALSSSLGLPSKVLFLGRRKNVFPFLRKASVFVLSSNWEGMPNVLLEAMAIGTPIVATDCPTGVREVVAQSSDDANFPVITERGILVEVGNETMLAEAMKSALSTKRKVVVDERFLMDNVLNEWEKII